MVEDFRFALLRHWSLYEAMLHSTYVAVRLQTWTDHGRRRLQELLARMGFLLAECCHDYGERPGRLGNCCMLVQPKLPAHCQICIRVVPEADPANIRLQPVQGTHCACCLTVDRALSLQLRPRLRSALLLHGE